MSGYKVILMHISWLMCIGYTHLGDVFWMNVIMVMNKVCV